MQEDRLHGGMAALLSTSLSVPILFLYHQKDRVTKMEDDTLPECRAVALDITPTIRSGTRYHPHNLHQPQDLAR